MAGGDCSTVPSVLTVNLALEHPVLQKLRRLTITVLKAIVQVLSLLSTGTKEEAVLMIETS